MDCRFLTRTAMTLLSSSEESSLSVSLHPLPLLNASEHLTRARLQSGNNSVRGLLHLSRIEESPRSTCISTVVGSLIGTQNGRDVEITNSFEFALTDQTLDINHAFFTTRRDQCKLVAAALQAIKSLISVLRHSQTSGSSPEPLSA